MNANHYIVRLIKRKEPVLFLEYATLAGLLNCIGDLKQKGVIVCDKKVKDSIRIEVECAQTGTGNLTPLGSFNLSMAFPEHDWVEMIKLTLIQNRLN